MSILALKMKFLDSNKKPKLVIDKENKNEQILLFPFCVKILIVTIRSILGLKIVYKYTKTLQLFTKGTNNQINL